MGKRHTSAGLLAVGTLLLNLYIRRRQVIQNLFRLSPAKYQVALKSGLPIQMPDGVRLIADHYYPRANGSFPTVLMRTPYGRGAAGGLVGILHEFVAQRFAERGYHVIIQDTRGRFDSEGEFEPFLNEAADGRATLEWVAAQPWFNGSLGMWGLSYGGFVQWAVAPDGPDYLKALVPAITGAQLCPYTGKAFFLDLILRWLENLSQPGGLRKQWDDIQRIFQPSMQTRIIARALTSVSFCDADTLMFGQPIPYYRKWLDDARPESPYWQSLDYSKQMARVNSAVHLVSGWHDFLLHQLTDDYSALRAAGHSPYLTIGPWRHGDFDCAMESLRSGIIWLDAQLKGDRRRLRELPVRLFVASPRGGTWRDFADFPPPARETRFYLCAPHQLTTGPARDNSHPDKYTYDPADPTPSVGGALYSEEGGSRDNRALEARPDVLTYTTEVLDRSFEVIGPVRLELYAHSSLPYTDFFARLCDIYPDGRSMNICDGLIRVEPGVGEPMADGTLRLVVDMWSTAYRFLPGHRIRLQVSSGAYPRWDRNLGTGEPLGRGTRMRVARQSIYRDRAHPSALVLPISNRE